MNKNTLFLIFLICCGSFIRIKELSLYDFSFDDFWHLYIANQDNLLLVLKKNFEVEFHPPLSVILWHFALKISDNQMWLRSFSIVFGLALIPSFYVLGKLFIDRFAGYLLSYLVTFGYVFVVQSAIIRAYIFMIFFLVWMMIFAYRYLQKPKTKYLWLYFGFAFCAAELYHYSCIAIMFLSSSLFINCYKNKNYEHLKIVILTNLLLLLLKLIYLTILVNLNRDIYVWEISDLKENYVVKLIFQILFFLFISDNYFFSNAAFLYDALNELFLFGFFYLIFKFIKEKKWHMLNMVFLPIIFSILMSHLNIIPHQYIIRRILFLIPNQLIILAILIVTLKNLLLKCLYKFKFIEFFKARILANFSIITIKSIEGLVIVVLCLYPIYFYSINAFSREYQSSIYFEDFVKAKQVELRDSIFSELLADDSNIMIVGRSFKWEFLYKIKNSDLKRLDRNLYISKIENKEVFFVFLDKFPAELRMDLFFANIKNYLLKNRQFYNKRNLIIVENCFGKVCNLIEANLNFLNCRFSLFNPHDRFNNNKTLSKYEFNFYDENITNYNFLKINFR